ncbi:MAG: HlyU family transcriptional regulator [Rhizobiaceae bacterium]
MSFLKRLFGGGGDGGSSGSGDKVAAEAQHKGFTIRATPFKEGGQFQTCGVVSKEIDGVTKEHRFIRADRFASLEDAANHAIVKGRQVVDEQGDRLFG